MLTRAIILYSLILFIIVVGVGILLFQFSENHIAEYQTIMQKGEKTEAFQGSQQKRFNVHKQFLSEDHLRKETDIKAEHSELVWEKKADDSKLIEHFQNLDFLSQENFQESPPTQIVRAIHSGDAVFDYFTQQLIAEDTHFARYQIPGHNFPEKIKSDPFMLAEAKSITYRLKDKLSTAELEGNLHLEMPLKGTLDCQKGYVDFQNSRAAFMGSENNPRIKYANINEDRQLFIESNEAELQFENEEKRPKVSSLEASGDTTVVYNNDYNLSAFKIRYEVPSEKIYAWSANADTPCEVKYKNDYIKSERILVNIPNKEIFFDKVNGNIKNETDFSCDQLIWNNRTQHLKLRNNVYLKHQGMGDLTTPHTIDIFQKENNGNKEIQFIEAKKETVITFVDNQKGYSHYLNCYGPLKMDYETQQILMNSSQMENKQVHFSNLMGDIFADSAILTYQKEGSRFVPLSLYMQGSVKVINRFNGHEKESGLELQNILADTITYFFEKKEMHLSSHSPNRVLLFDRINNMQMSAPAFIVTHDESYRPTVKGVGKTRLKFAERELQQMKYYFNLKDNP
jgi:hypothetical protein